jgi:protein TonB
MPRDLFGDVTHPSISVGNRKWYTVPLSLAAHVSVIVSIVLVSVVAHEFVPLPREVVTYVGGVTPPEPPTPPRPASPAQAPPSRPDVAPLEAPEGIAPDTGIERPQFEDLGDGVDVGLVIPDGPAVPGDMLVPPPPPPKPREPVTVGGNIKMPAKLRGSAPVYPAIAQAAGVQGTVILEALLDDSGRVQNVRVLRSIHLLDQAAVDAVRTWEYTPTLLNGVPVPVVMTVTVTFTLNR